MIKQGELVDITITDLNSSGDGVGRLEGQVIFVPATVTGDRVSVRITHVKRQYAYGKVHAILDPSPYRIRPRCIVADKCGGCQWQHIDAQYQREAKYHQVVQTLQRVGGFGNPPVAPMLKDDQQEFPTLGYRNKATYPLGVSSTGTVKAGYYRPNTHILVNLNQCPVQDERLNPLLAEIKGDIQGRGWTIYNEQHHQGQLRHLALRIGRRTGEILLTLITTDWDLAGITEQAQLWLERYPGLMGVTLNYQPHRNNVIFGDKTRLIAGQPYIREIFAGLEFRLGADTFFQVNTETAERLLEVIIERLNLQGTETLLDAYCGIGTFTLPLAQRVKQAIGMEVYAASVAQAQENAQINQIFNVKWVTGAVETALPELEVKPDLVLLDPPRQGCDRRVIETLLQLNPEKIVYISCQGATLARDLKLLCQSSRYQLTWVQPADFFPQTSHLECVAFLSHSSSDVI